MGGCCGHLAVFRRFVTATAERLVGLLARPLGDRRWPVIMLGGRLLVVALGITGTKVLASALDPSMANSTRQSRQGRGR